MSDLKQTDLSKRLRLTLERGIDSNGMRTLLLKAADEIERYYTGMLNWKATAEAQSTQPEATKPAQDLGAAILALEVAEPYGYGCGETMAFERGVKDALKAASALTSPADALVAGDRVDAARYRWLREKRDIPHGSRNIPWVVALDPEEKIHTMILRAGIDLDHAIDAAMREQP